MIYGCTSGTIANGTAEIERLVQAARPGIAVTNPASAVLAALKHLKVTRVSILTPYIRELNEAMLEFYRAQGIDVINIAGLGFDDDVEITGIPADAIYKAALAACDPESDALFISCTALRLSKIIEPLEQHLDKPVFGSNQALVWHSLGLLGYGEPVMGFGRLLGCSR
jgi:maleate isomerase